MSFVSRRRLRFGDCDPSGIAYFPSYFDLLVSVTEDLFESVGWSWPRLADEFDIATPTVRLDTNFIRPGFQGDNLTFECRVARLGASSLDLSHAVASATPLWHASQRLVATSISTRRAIPWPDPVRAAFIPLVESDDA